MDKDAASKLIDQEARFINGLTEVITGIPNQFSGPAIAQTNSLFLNLRNYFVSNMRQPLSSAYCELGILKAAVDVPVDDAFRGGIDFTSKELSPEELEELHFTLEQEGDDLKLAEAKKWDRLYGGAGVLIMTDQDYEEPLDLEAIGMGDEIEFKAVDMWELFWDKQNVESFDPSQLGPRFEHYDYYGKRIHRSRVLIMKGVPAPSFLRPRLRGWGLSIAEILIRSINQYLKATDLTYQVLDEFKVDIYKIKDLNTTLGSGIGDEKIRRRIMLANYQKNYQNAITMDSEDDFGQKELSFQGIAETMLGIRMQVASDLRMPMSKLFGIASVGFSSGEDDIENYNAMVESTVRRDCKKHAIVMAKIRCQQLFGFIPEDLRAQYKPLRILSSEQEEAVKSSKFNRLLAARTAHEITSKEFKDACNKDNLLVIQVDTNVDSLDEKTDEAEAMGNVTAEVETKAAGVSATAPKLAKNSLFAHFNGPQIVTVGVVSGDKLLTGKRRDNGLWVSPGGHIDSYEGIFDAAIREVQEESGITLTKNDLRHISSKIINSPRTGKDFVVHAFLASIAQEKATAKNDPDDEVSEWKWVKIDKESKELKPEVRHAKDDHILNYLFEHGGKIPL